MRFACKLFFFFQSNQDNGGSTVSLLALTWECRNVHMRADLVSDRTPLLKQMHYELLLKRRKTVIKFFSVPEGSTPEMALVTMQARLVFTPKWERSCPPFWSSRRGILRTVWWLRPKVLWRNKKVIQHTQERTYNYIKHLHPEKSALVKHTLELEHRMKWSKTQIVTFENDFR